MIKQGNLEEEEKYNVSRGYSKKEWKKLEKESIDFIDNLFGRKLGDSSVVEHSPDKTGVEGSNPSLPTNI
jgi:hypothetical protein